jgi:hypothetical protein
MLHCRAIEERRKAGDRFNRGLGAAARGLGYRRLQIPKDARGFCLAQWQKALGGGEKSRDGLMEIREDGAVFWDLQRAAGKAESRAMVDESGGLFGSAERRAQDRRIMRRGYGVQKIPAEGGAAQARFSRRAERAETSIDLRPASGVEIYPCGDSQAVRFAAEDGFQHSSFFEIGAEKFGQVCRLENFLCGEGFEAEGMGEGTDGESGVGEVAEAKICQVR